MKDLWSLLLEAQESTAGVPKRFVEEKKAEMRAARDVDTRALHERDRRSRLDEMRDSDRPPRGNDWDRGGGGDRGRGRGRGRGGGWGGPPRERDSGWGAKGGGGDGGGGNEHSRGNNDSVREPHCYYLPALLTMGVHSALLHRDEGPGLLLLMQNVGSARLLTTPVGDRVRLRLINGAPGLDLPTSIRARLVQALRLQLVAMGVVAHRPEPHLVALDHDHDLGHGQDRVPHHVNTETGRRLVVVLPDVGADVAVGGLDGRLRALFLEAAVALLLLEPGQGRLLRRVVGNVMAISHVTSRLILEAVGAHQPVAAASAQVNVPTRRGAASVETAHVAHSPPGGGRLALRCRQGLVRRLRGGDRGPGRRDP
jgi:hypothetical protein